MARPPKKRASADRQPALPLDASTQRLMPMQLRVVAFPKRVEKPDSILRYPSGKGLPERRGPRSKIDDSLVC